jgi:hypothetical protein
MRRLYAFGVLSGLVIAAGVTVGEDCYDSCLPAYCWREGYTPATVTHYKVVGLNDCIQQYNWNDDNGYECAMQNAERTIVQVEASSPICSEFGPKPVNASSPSCANYDPMGKDMKRNCCQTCSMDS